MANLLTPYITLDGNCEEAVTFYQKALGAESQIMRAGDAPPNPDFSIPEAKRNLVMHAEIMRNEGQAEGQLTLTLPWYSSRDRLLIGSRHPAPWVMPGFNLAARRHVTQVDGRLFPQRHSS